MTDKDIKNNFQLCIKWLQDNSNQIGHSPLLIGWGNSSTRDYYCYNKDFCGYDHNVVIGGVRGINCLSVCICERGIGCMDIYGYDSDDIKEWKESYEGTGMVCPNYRHTFDELTTTEMEMFLTQWKRIKEKVIERIEEMNSLDSFEV